MREIKLLILKNTVLEKKHREWLWNIGSGFFEAEENQQKRCEKTAKGQRREVRESKTSRLSGKLSSYSRKEKNKQTNRKLGLVLRWKKFDTAIHITRETIGGKSAHTQKTPRAWEKLGCMVL